MATFGQDLVRLLRAHGITHAFGIPGVHTVELYRGLPGSGITHITPRHEQGAGFMAYGYAVATGRPAACFLITGPGLANATTAMGEARAESIPMLVVATNNSVSQLGMDSGYLHATKSQMAIAEQVSDFCHQLLDQDNAPCIVGQAFSRFHGARPGPAYLEIPLDLLSQPSRIAMELWPTATRPTANQEAIAEAASILSKAKHPIMLIGGGACGAALEVQALCELLDCPVVSSTSGKGILSEDHDLSLGAALPFRPVQEYMERADVVLAVGTEMAETDTLYTYSEYKVGGALIRIDIDIDQLNRNYRPKLAILSDAQCALESLVEQISTASPMSRSDSGVQIVADLKSRAIDQWLPGADAHKTVLDILRDVLDDDAVLSTEECQLGYTANQYFKCRRPRTYIHPTGYGTLGPALPAAIGAKVGAPDRQVLAIVGDGSFLFTVGELASAVELSISLPIIVWNNKGYREIANYMDRFDIERIGVDLETPDFLALAKGFGCLACRPGSAQEFRDAVLQALTAPKPTLIEIMDDASWLR